MLFSLRLAPFARLRDVDDVRLVIERKVARASWLNLAPLACSALRARPLGLVGGEIPGGSA